MGMTNEQRAAGLIAFEGLLKNLERAAAIIDGLSKMLMTAVDGGALPPNVASEVQATVGDAGVRAEEYRALARQARAGLYAVYEESLSKSPKG